MSCGSCSPCLHGYMEGIQKVGECLEIVHQNDQAEVEQHASQNREVNGKGHRKGKEFMQAYLTQTSLH